MDALAAALASNAPLAFSLSSLFVAVVMPVLGWIVVVRIFHAGEKRGAGQERQAADATVMDILREKGRLAERDEVTRERNARALERVDASLAEHSKQLDRWGNLLQAASDTTRRDLMQELGEVRSEIHKLL